jgi:regulatory protein
VPQITAVKPQKNKKRVNIYLDGKFGFGIDYENFIKLGLKVEQELNEADIEKIIKEAEYAKIKDKIIRYATIRPRSKKEVEVWMIKKKVHASIKKDLFRMLKKLELLDDSAFATWWIKQRLDFKPRGKKALFSELMKKGVDRKIIKEELSKITIDEASLAKELVKRRSYKWEKYKGEKRSKKIQDYLARKGFNWDVVKQVVESN